MSSTELSTIMIFDRKMKEERDYWLDRLSQEMEPSGLRPDHPRPESYTGETDTVEVSLPLDTCQKLAKLTSGSPLLLYTTLMAALKICLHKYTGSTAIVMGSPVPRQNDEPCQSTNVLAIMDDIDDQLSFRQLLVNVRQTLLDAYARPRYPFDRLVRDLGLKGVENRCPLFGVALVMEGYHGDMPEVKNDITITLVKEQDHIRGRVMFNKSLFKRDTVERFAGHWMKVLQAGVADTDALISELPMLTEAERHQLLVEWNETEVAYPQDRCIHELFEAQVKRTPDAVAVVFPSTSRRGERSPEQSRRVVEPSGHGGDEHLTYRELNRRANQLAHYLRDLGVGPEMLVGICVERSLEMIVGVLGILKAGGAYVPLDPTYPAERLALMWEDFAQGFGAAPVLLSQHQLAEKLPANQANAVYLDADWEMIEGRNDQNLASVGGSENLAYVIYTSGSTGRPKGVMIPQRALVNHTQTVIEDYPLSPKHRLLQLISLSFDVSAEGIFPVLASGATLVLPDDTMELVGRRLLQFCEQQSVTILPLPAPVWHQWVDALASSEPSILASLEVLPLGGESLAMDKLETWARLAGPRVKLVNEYGPTETTIAATRYEMACDVETVAGLSRVPIGRPNANAKVYLLDAHLQPVPVGVPGELYIGGVGLGRGYLNHPELTAEVFVPNPFPPSGGEERGGARLYKTGDMARYLPDGNIEFLGRVDYQVKVRGFRVELGEIEAVLAQHPAVRETVVLAREDEPGDPSSPLRAGKRLVAYVVTTREREPAASELRRFLQGKLPEYMVPSAFVTLEAFPLTPTGKINRRALPAPERVRSELVETFVAPRNPVEEVLAGIWAQVLGLERVGVHDNFFELGGHSLLAVQLASHIHEAFQVELPLRDLFESPTVAGLAAAIAQREGKRAEREDAVVSLPTIVPDPSGRYQPFPLTDVQQAYWIGRNGVFELGNVATHGYMEFDAIGLDVERFELALQRLIERHDMLRAIVRPDGQQQILEQVPPYRIEASDLRGQGTEAVATHLEAVRERMSHQVLPSDQWPLFEIRATRLDDQRVRIHISVDALISDAWSAHILGRELIQFYQDPDTSLPPLELSFRDYVLAELAFRDSELYQRSLNYWQSLLPTLPPAPELPLARSPGSLTQPRFVRRSARLGPDAWRRLKDRATRAGLTPSGALLAAFAEVLTVWSKNPRFTINLTLFNRLPLHPQVSNVVGDFTSLTLLAVDNSAQEEFKVRARRLQERLWEDLDHRHVSGVRVLREMTKMQGGALRASMPVVFTSVLNLDDGRGEERTPSPFELDTPGREDPDSDGVYSITQTSQVWIDHQVSEQEGTLVLSWDAVEDLFPEGLLDDMFATYSHLLHRLADGDNAWRETTRQLVQVPAAQLEQRAAANATEAPVSEELLHTLFAAQVEQRPNQAAVIAPDRTLTYEELHRRSNQIGHWLRERGAQPNRLVAVVMEKGWEQVVAVLGVLKAGAAYLPIAADLPQERIEYLLENGEVELVLTQSWLDKNLAWPENVQRLCVDGDLEGVDDHPLTLVQGPEDLAYVIYTSGSTGQPKGVMIDHRGAVNTILDINQRFRVGPEDRVLALSSLGFDLSVYDIFGLLAAGGTIVIPDATVGRDPAHWAELMARERVTLWDTVPALMEMLVEYVEGRSEHLPDSLRVVFMSGDWIPVTLPDRIKALADGVEVFSGGGATEASIWSIIYPIEEVNPEWQSIPYGKPMVNQSFHVLDEWLEPCPVWVPGQLHIGRIGLAKGYWRDEERTNASFITHPRTGERLYRTGDLGRYLPGGNIEFLGREDFQVKIRGYRIELGEIEAVLAQHPVVRLGVVTAMGDPRGDKRLVAYVVPDRERVPALDEPQPMPDRQFLQDYEPSQTKGVLLDPMARLKFKLAHPGLRGEDGERPRIQLARPELDKDLVEAYAARRSYRKFLSQPISFEQFGRFLSCLLQVELDGVPLPKSRYGSAGSLYPVQVYLYVKPDRVEDLAGGTYYYHPLEHRLALLSADARIDRGAYQLGNRAIFDASAFSIFLVGHMDAITPMYGEWARDFCMLEAGLMTQLLEMSAPACQIGLCQVGGFDFEPIRHWFALGESHVYLHGLLGGPIDVNQTRLQALVEDSGELCSFLELFQEESGQGDRSAFEQVVPPATFLPVQESEPEGAIVSTLRSFLREKLPEYMVPSAFVLLDALPLTPNGKVDRRALPLPEEDRVGLEKVFVAPRTPTEEVLAGIWAKVLGIEQVGVYDNFVELGGHSLLATQVISRAREAFEVELPLRTIFETPTVAGLAQAIDALLEAEPSVAVPTITSYETLEEVEL